MNSASTAGWGTLLAVEAGSAATLTGLVFVAVSINLNRVMAIPGLSGRAAESILQFFEIFLVSTAVLIPGQSQYALAVEILAIGVVLWMVQVAGQIRYLRLRGNHPWSWLAYRALFSQCATIRFIVAGVGLLADWPGAMYWLMPGFVCSFFAGGLSAWVLLVEIMR